MTFWVDGDEPDKLARLLKDSTQNNRLDVWLWLCLYIYEKLDLERSTCNGTTMRDEIAHALARHPDLVSRIQPERDRFLLRDDLLAWITKDERQYHWLLPQIDEITGRILPRRLVHLTGRSELIAMLDVWQVNIEEKADEVRHLHEEWRRHIALDSQFEWFADKKEGAKRCVCAWEWLEKNHLSPRSRQLPISNHKELLMFFDQAQLGPHEQKAMIQEIKNRWHRQQFDERNADKKQVNVMLSKAVVDQLDMLAKQNGVKRPQVIETLVKMEAEAGIYLAGA
ncbi:hypothetical protein [Pseudomonas sp. PNP]|uniref:hypothetical protein n=1 Tax=Pseudomonas sp. PNP TaxID=361819 RepID=UPI001AECF98B|nr:hypothetical protein [Pseudomonas sp. PNP]MBP2842809.1 hypothetical protein [Pseudomonas sp. PNP]